MAKKIIPSLELDSNKFEEKVLISLKQTGNVRVVPRIIQGGENKDLNRFAFALMNTTSSKRKHCNACSGKHWYFVISSDMNSKNDETGLCDSCGIFLQNMVLLGVPSEEIQKWIKSEGEIDPHDLMRDAIQEGIKKGEIEMRQNDK